MLAKCTPATPAPCAQPLEFAFVCVIRDFHVTWQNRDTRFYADYATACRALKRALTHLDEILPNTRLVDAESPGGSRELQVMDRTWDAVMIPDRPYTMHHLWFDLHNLRTELSVATEPVLQRVFLAGLPRSVQAAIINLLSPEDARSAAVLNKLYKKLCMKTLDTHGKVSLWYNNAYLGSNSLLAAGQEVSAPTSLLGRGVACLWAWFGERSRTNRSVKTTSMVICNRWGWAKTISAEFRWLAMPDEVRAWTICFWAGILSLKFLRDLQLDALALTADCLDALAEHDALAGLDLRACGIMPHRAAMPKLPRLRRLTLIWDPASAFESAAASELIPLAKNVVHLHLENRIRGGPIPLAFHPTWSAPRLRKLERLVLNGVAAKFAQALLSACRTSSLESFVVRFRFSAALPNVRSILLYAAACSTALDELVIDGLDRPGRRLFRDIVKYFPVLRSLAVLPRLHNQVDVSTFCWNSTVWNIAEQLRPLRQLQRVCTNYPVCADAIGPMYLDQAKVDDDRGGAQVAAGQLIGDDNVDEGEAAVMAFAFHCPALTEVVFATRGEAYIARVRRHEEGFGRCKSIRMAACGSDGPWWKM